LILIVFSACEKVINYELTDSKEEIVIEAAISNKKGALTILVSKTSPYLGAQTKNHVSGAKVSIRVDKGSTKYFTETDPGVYTLKDIVMTPNYWYVVDVEYDGVIYSARSFMNERVPIADLQFTYFDGLGFFDSG
jgi:hypothetical protein